MAADLVSEVVAEDGGAIGRVPPGIQEPGQRPNAMRRPRST
jgi:hypothetical protein